jgi:hypothetical protein
LIHLHFGLYHLFMKVVLKLINQISTPCQSLIKEDRFHLSTMLDLKRPMDVLN